MSIIGIDYGSMNITVGAAAGMGGGQARGGIQIVLNEGSGRFTPNIATFEGDKRDTGAMAKTKERSNYKNTVTNLKRLIGRKYSDPSVQETLKRMYCRTKQLENDDIGIVVNFEGKEQTFLPEQIVAMQLNNIQSFAKKYTNQDVNDVVLSVPMYFTDRQRQAMLDACKIAGIRCYRVINDTTATALSYGILRKKKLSSKPTNVMFLDMGYGDFQVSVVALTDSGMTVKGTAFDANLGGYNFDMLLAEHLNAQFMEKHKIDLRKYPKSWIKLLQAAEKAKKTMSPVGVNKARVSLECIYKELDFRGEVTIEQLESLTKDLIPRVDKTIQRALDAAGLKKEDLASCEATGGSIRMRFVKSAIGEMLGADKMSFTLNQDECTARGCAIMSAILSPKVKVLPYKILDAVETPVSITWQQTKVRDPMDVEGKESAGTNALTIFKKSDPYPKEIKVTFKRTQSFRLNAVYDDMTELPKGTPKLIGAFDVDMKNAEEAIAAAAKEGRKNEVRVFFECNASGIVTLNSAEYMRKNKQPEPTKEEEEATTAAAGDGGDDDKNSSEKTSEDKEDAASDSKKDGNDADDASSKEENQEKSDKKVEPSEPKKPKHEKKKPKAKKVPKYTRITLKTTRLEPLGLGPKKLEELHASEMGMQQRARILIERSQARNDLESFVYDMRDKLDEDEELEAFMPENFKEKYKAKLDVVEDWLYSEEGFDSAKKVYVQKKAALESEGLAVSMRRDEFNKRPAALKALDEAVAAYREMVSVSTSDADEKKYAHWDDADRKVMTDACDKAHKWFVAAVGKLDATPKHENPPVKVKDILAEKADLDTACRPVVTKPVPKPKEPEKKEEASEDDAAGSKKETDKSTEGDNSKSEDKGDSSAADDGSKKTESEDPMDTSS